MTQRDNSHGEFVVRPVELRDLRQWAEMRAALWPDESLDELAAELRSFRKSLTNQEP
jgi:hypothetical protein